MLIRPGLVHNLEALGCYTQRPAFIATLGVCHWHLCVGHWMLAPACDGLHASSVPRRCVSSTPCARQLAWTRGVNAAHHSSARPQRSLSLNPGRQRAVAVRAKEEDEPDWNKVNSGMH